MRFHIRGPVCCLFDAYSFYSYNGSRILLASVSTPDIYASVQGFFWLQFKDSIGSTDSRIKLQLTVFSLMRIVTYCQLSDNILYNNALGLRTE